MAQLVDLSRLSVDDALHFQAQRYAVRLERGLLLGDAAERAQTGDEQRTCSSCSAVAAGRASSPHGPWHCNACWGEGPSGDMAVIPKWWDAHTAWLDALEPAMRRETIAVAGTRGLTVVTDPGNGSFPGVGAEKMWPVAERLAEFLKDHYPSGLSGVRCVELGAGVGVPGMLLARRGAKVYLTDLPWLLPLTELNVRANFDEDDEHRPAVLALRWGCAPDLEAMPPQPELVVASDCVSVFGIEWEEPGRSRG